MHLRSPLPVATWLALAALLAAPALAGGPRTERITGHDTFAKGTLEGLTLDAEGVLRLGLGFQAVPLEADSAWCQAQSSHSLWIGLGTKPAVQRVHPDGGARIELGEGLMVTALAALPADHVAAAVFPGGRIVKVSPDGKVTPHARLPVEHVWAMTSTETGVITAACGVPGTLYRIDPFGGVSKLAAVDDAHARCLARSTDGKTLYVGTAPKGRVLAFASGALRVVRDLEPQEVVGIVPLRDGGLIVAANADQAGGNAQQIATLLRQMTEPAPTKPGQKEPPRAALQDGTLLHLEASGVTTELWAKKKTAILSLAPDGAGAVAGTYPGGRVIGVSPGHAYRLVADLPEAEASVVVSARGRFVAVATSNPAVFHAIDESRTTGTWTSAPHDAGAPSRWGRVTLWGRGIRTLSYRSGATSEPDDTWHPWRSLADFDGSAGAMDVTARFVQWRAVLAGGEAELRSLTAVTRTPNRGPTVTELTVKKPGQTQDAPPVATTKRDLAWKAEDPDKDRLRTTVQVNRQGSPHWVTLVDGKVLDKAKHTWDTQGMPDGDYRVAVQVDDGADNEAPRVRTARRVLTGVRVDNTPPTVTLKAARRADGSVHVVGVASDPNGGQVHAVRASLNGGPWMPLAAKDRLYDSAREAYEGVLRLVVDAPAIDVVVQVTDADGNLAAGATVVR